MLYVEEERRRKLLEELRSIRTKGLTPSQASKLTGKLQFTLSWSFGRIGRAALQPFFGRVTADESVTAPTPGLTRAAGFLADIMANLPAIDICLDRAWEAPILVWSDAMYEKSGDIPAQGGFVVRIPGTGGGDPVTYYSRHATPKSVLKQFVPGKKQYIGQLELLYAVAVYTTLPKKFANRRVIHFIDNTSAVAGLIKGYSRAIDSGRIVNAFHALNAGLRAETFFEYVRSKANIADLPSRGEMHDLRRILTEAGGFGNLRQVQCILPSMSDWHDHAAVWMQRGAREREKKANRASAKSRKRARNH